MEECLKYFRQLIRDPLSVPPWSEWWRANSALAESAFSRMDFVRLKHRKLRGAIQILQSLGELPEGYCWPGPLLTGSCGCCGDRTTIPSADPGGGYVTCPNCGLIGMYDSRREPSLDSSSP